MRCVCDPEEREAGSDGRRAGEPVWPPCTGMQLFTAIQVLTDGEDRTAESGR